MMRFIYWLFLASIRSSKKYSSTSEKEIVSFFCLNFLLIR
nr:MAG TPA: hypothetical protein [Caudoviricetes sp.]